MNVLPESVPLIYCRMVLFIMFIKFFFFVTKCKENTLILIFLSTQIICSSGFTCLLKIEVFTHNVEFLLLITDNSVISRHVLNLVDVCDELLWILLVRPWCTDLLRAFTPT